jgi:transcriptional regulator with XRE-family HTH domain
MDLKSARKKRGWTLEDVAHLVGVKTPATVSRHEAGSRRPEDAQLVRYLAIYSGDVTEEDIRKTRRTYLKSRSAGSEPSTHEEPINA